MSARTLPEYRKQGLFFQMSQYGKHIVLKKFPNLRTSLYTSNLAELPQNLKEIDIVEVRHRGKDGMLIRFSHFGAPVEKNVRQTDVPNSATVRAKS